MKTKTQKSRISSPNVIFALSNSDLRRSVASLLEARGWRFRHIQQQDALRRKVSKMFPAVVVLPVENKMESGWLMCAKLRMGQPHLRVILIGKVTPENERLAEFVGAEKLLPEDVGCRTLIAAICNQRA
jgi:DNA-binding response OmpR family regulator